MRASAGLRLPTGCPRLRPCCLQVGQKRGRSQLEELNAEALDGSKRKKIRLGFPASQWVTVYNKHPPMKQRWVPGGGGGGEGGGGSHGCHACTPDCLPACRLACMPGPLYVRVPCTHVFCPTLNLKHPPHLPRSYHYNVSNHRLDVHVSKGFDDGLYISSV